MRRLRLLHDLLHQSFLHDLAAVHDDDAIGDRRQKREIVISELPTAAASSEMV